MVNTLQLVVSMALIAIPYPGTLVLFFEAMFESSNLHLFDMGTYNANALNLTQ